MMLMDPLPALPSAASGTIHGDLPPGPLMPIWDDVESAALAAAPADGGPPQPPHLMFVKGQPHDQVFGAHGWVLASLTWLLVRGVHGHVLLLVDCMGLSSWDHGIKRWDEILSHTSCTLLRFPDRLATSTRSP